ncbi:carboxylating nicotinate-nucleotide diphosphorylase [Helicobacter sp. 23-1045]
MSVRDFVKSVIAEDLGRGDLFERCISHELAHKKVEAQIIAKESGIFSGEVYLNALYEIFKINAEFLKADGQHFKRGEVLVKLRGNYIDILQSERVGLNMLAHSSGIATNTGRFVAILRENGANLKILDTRKTRPLLREMEKYSVRNGGGINHRFGLDDCLMLKDTNLAHIADLSAFIANARAQISWVAKIEVECESIESAESAMNAGADIIMCDNMSAESVSKVAKIRNEKYPHILLEASGNITEQNIAQYAKLGVDAVSIGALIHQAKWVDLSLKMK